jgi:hypothetical protein
VTLRIRNPETDELARRSARRTGKPITVVVNEALRPYEAALPAADDETERMGRQP